MHGRNDCGNKECRGTHLVGVVTRGRIGTVRRAVFLLSMGLSAFSLAEAPLAAAEKVSIGTGSKTGVYYRVGRAICVLVAPQEEEQEDGLACEAVPTAGSIANLDAIRRGELEIAVVQSDWHYHAVHGSGPFAEVGPNRDLRALFSVHGEPFTVVARRDSGIRTFDDLEGERVNIGNPGSGQRATMEVIMDAKGWTKEDFELADELPAEQQSLALCHDRVQAIVYTVGHPNPSIGQSTGLCDATIIEVAGPEIDKLVAERPYYAYTEIPGGIYSGNPEPVRTFGVKATVVSSANVDPDTIYSVVSAVFDDLARFRTMHPAFGTLSPEAMIRDGISAPLHEGAMRYFQEAGLLPPDDPGETPKSE